MPPWSIDNSGACQTFEHARWLPQQDIDTISAWVEGGMASGTATELPPAQIDTLQGERDVLLATMAEPYAPDTGDGANDYRCFALDMDVPEDTFITGFEVVPGNPEILHHLLGWVVDLGAPAGADAEGNPITVGDSLRTLDDEAPGAGWPCYGGIPVRGGGLAVTWIPGTRVIRYPDNVGFRLGTTSTLVVQAHYWAPTPASADETAIRVATRADVELPATVALLDGLLGTQNTLAPGQESVQVTWDALAVTAAPRRSPTRCRSMASFPICTSWAARSTRRSTVPTQTYAWRM
jgi:hypothetical protein